MAGKPEFFACERPRGLCVLTWAQFDDFIEKQERGAMWQHIGGCGKRHGRSLAGSSQPAQNGHVHKRKGPKLQGAAPGAPLLSEFLS